MKKIAFLVMILSSFFLSLSLELFLQKKEGDKNIILIFAIGSVLLAGISLVILNYKERSFIEKRKSLIFGFLLYLVSFFYFWYQWVPKLGL